jgi:phospholipid-binding lipoprotein MlaA
MTPSHRAFAGALVALSLSGCATTAATTAGDPLERMNRATHRFNDAIDRAVLKPVATRYRDHVPQWIRTGVGNVLEHLGFPTTIVNDLLQLKIKDTLVDLGRFTVNSTLGIGGLLDPASRFGIPKNDEDFGQTLGRWGMPAGPYLVLPLLGPSTVRDAPSNVVDGYTDIRTQADLKDAERAGVAALSIVDRRAQLLSLESSLQSAFDRYAFIRDAWLQRREYQVKDGDVPEQVPEQIPQEEIEALDAEIERERRMEREAQDPAGEEPAEPPPDQPPPSSESSSVTSLMPASVEAADGRFR